MPAQPRSSPLWRSSGLGVEHRSKSSAIMALKRIAFALETRHSHAPSYTSGQCPSAYFKYPVTPLRDALQQKSFTSYISRFLILDK